MSAAKISVLSYFLTEISQNISGNHIYLSIIISILRSIIDQLYLNILISYKIMVNGFFQFFQGETVFCKYQFFNSAERVCHISQSNCLRTIMVIFCTTSMHFQATSHTIFCKTGLKWKGYPFCMHCIYHISNLNHMFHCTMELLFKCID